MRPSPVMLRLVHPDIRLAGASVPACGPRFATQTTSWVAAPNRTLPALAEPVMTWRGSAVFLKSSPGSIP
jgi:hypothetical protein